MATSLKEGSQNSKFSGITFTHQLTQISVKVYAETEAAKTFGVNQVYPDKG